MWFASLQETGWGPSYLRGLFCFVGKSQIRIDGAYCKKHTNTNSSFHTKKICGYISVKETSSLLRLFYCV